MTYRKHYNRGAVMERGVGLVLYLAGGWRTYQQIADEFGGCVKTARRRVRSVEAAGLPVEWCNPPDQQGTGYTNYMRLPPDWVARTPWLRRYVIVQQPKGVK